MPTREYQCSKCETVKEYLEPLESPLRRVCGVEDCKGLSKRIMSVPSPIPNHKSHHHENESYVPGVLVLEIIIEHGADSKDKKVDLD